MVDLSNFWGTDRARRRADEQASGADSVPTSLPPNGREATSEISTGAQTVATPATPKSGPAEMIGAASLALVMDEMEHQDLSEESNRFHALATGFTPLDDVLNGGLRPGELLILGGAFGVGKTIFSLQMARNVVLNHPKSAAMYICYEHDRTHLLARLLCLESAEQGYRDDALTLRFLAQIAKQDSGGLISRLRATPRYAPIMRAIDSYADRLLLVKASGHHSTLQQVTEWTKELEGIGNQNLLVVDYLQKIPLGRSDLQNEDEITTYLTQSLKELAMQTGLRIVAIAAADRVGLKARRMRLSDLRGSSALQYEADIGLVLNNKHAIVSREHMIYNLNQAEAMRSYVVMSVEKNRAGRNAVDMEYQQDAAHFRLIAQGNYVSDRLVDDKVTLE